MIREIKFRAWHTVGKKLFYDDFPGDSLRWKFKENQPVEIMQFTGLKDKNGKEIYEGDVVVVLSGEPAIIVFRNGSFMLEWIGFDSYADLLGWIDFKKCVEYEGVSFEIIGNIYENPELIKENVSAQ